MSHDQLRAIIERYTPTMLEVVAPSSPDEIVRLESAAGELPESYLAFLNWMGDQCPFLDGCDFGYSPKALLEVYEDPDDEVAADFILIGIDNSGNGYDVCIRREDGAVARLSEFYEAETNEDLFVENVSLDSFLLTTYVRKTLVPSHPFHASAALTGDDAQIQDMWHRVDETCGHFDIPYSIVLPDFRFYGSENFVVAVHQRPESMVVNLHVGAVDRARFETWYDLIFDRWQLTRMP